MGKKEKLIKRLKSRPKDFTFEHKANKTNILLHRPHPRKELLEYQIKQLVNF